MNLDAFDRAARISGQGLERLVQDLDTQLNEAQKRHQERLKKLLLEQAKEQQQTKNTRR